MDPQIDPKQQNFWNSQFNEVDVDPLLSFQMFYNYFSQRTRRLSNLFLVIVLLRHRTTRARQQRQI